MLNAITVNDIRSAGQISPFKPRWRKPPASDTIRPQAIAGGGGPRPRKLRLDSSSIASPNERLACTMRGAKRFGTTAFCKVRQCVAPSARDASTYSTYRTPSVTLYTMRAYLGMYKMPITIMRICRWVPSKETIKMAKMMDGKAISTSMPRIIKVSNFPRK